MQIKPILSLTTFLALGCALLLPSVCRADVFTGPNGSYSTPGTGPSNAVWDVSGIPAMTNAHVHITTKDQSTVDVECPIAPLNQNGSGKISGAGSGLTTLIIDDYRGYREQIIDGDYTIKGSIAGGKGKAHGTLMATIRGVADIEDKMRKVTATRTTKFAIDNVAGTIIATRLNRASAAGTGSISSRDASETELLADVFSGDGSWTLAMTLATTNKTVTGTATVTLNSGRVFDYTVKGTYNATTQQSRLVLKGIDNAKGSVLQVRMNADTVTLIKGKVSGQAVNVVRL